MTRKQLKRMAYETMDYEGRFTVRDLIENMIVEREWQRQRLAAAILAEWLRRGFSDYELDRR